MKATLKYEGAELIGIGAIKGIGFSEFGQVGHWGHLSSVEGDLKL